MRLSSVYVGVADDTDACEGAEVDRFLRNGRPVRNLDVWVVDVEELVAGDEDTDESELEEVGDEAYRLDVGVSANEESSPVPDNGKHCSFFISPKYFSVIFNASLWFTPTNATTILSG